MDEPASALDPLSTYAIEDLMQSLKKDATVVVVTHNMEQVARISDIPAFVSISGEGQPGRLVEVAPDRTAVHQPGKSPDRGLHRRSLRLKTPPCSVGCHPA